MDSESNLDYENTEQLIGEMMSFLDESTECPQSKEIKETNSPLCTGIKTIIEMFPPPAVPPPIQTIHQSFQSKQVKSHPMDRACRYKDPYMQEVNRLMFCSTMGHPTNGSPEYFKAAESYAITGKDFLDFPTDIKFASSLANPPNSSQLTGMTTPTFNNPQMPVLMNPASYWNANCPFYQNTAFPQPPYLYSNPFLMTQYLNMFVRETSIVQQQQFLTGGIHERLVYAQMLQQQCQANQVSQGSLNFQGISGFGMKLKTKLQDVKKLEILQGSEESDCKKIHLNGRNLNENCLELED